MKKMSIKLIVLVLIAVLILTGCNGNEVVEQQLESIEETTEMASEETEVTTEHEIITLNDVDEPLESIDNAVLTDIIGDVVVERNNEEIVIEENISIYENDIIYTGDDSSVNLAIGDNINVTIEANSILLFSKNEASNKNMKVIIALKTGTCITDVDEKLNENSGFEIMTPAQITSIRGTVASVTYDAIMQRSEILFFEGYGLVADIKTGKIAQIVVGQSLKIVDEQFEYSVIEEENLNAANLEYLKDNEELFKECLVTIENTTIDLTQELVIDEFVINFSIGYDETPTDFYTEETEVEQNFKKRLNENKGKKNENKPGEGNEKRDTKVDPGKKN